MRKSGHQRACDCSASEDVSRAPSGRWWWGGGFPRASLRSARGWVLAARWAAGEGAPRSRSAILQPGCKKLRCARRAPSGLLSPNPAAPHHDFQARQFSRSRRSRHARRARGAAPAGDGCGRDRPRRVWHVSATFVAARSGPLARRSRESPHGPRGRQPLVGGVFRARPRGVARRFRTQGRPADASRIARLARGGIHGAFAASARRRRCRRPKNPSHHRAPVVDEAPPPPHRDQRHLSPVLAPDARPAGAGR